MGRVDELGKPLTSLPLLARALATGSVTTFTMVVLRAIHVPFVVRNPVMLIAGIVLFASGFSSAIRSPGRWSIYIGGCVLGLSVGWIVGLLIFHRLPLGLLVFQIAPMTFGAYMIARGVKTA